MLTVISPAKKLDYSSTVSSTAHSQPALLEHSQELLTGLKALSPKDVCALMGLSDKLGALNYERFQEWQTPFTTDNARPAVLAFKGDVYQGLDAESMSDKQLDWAQDNLRILSGLYGLLRPLDLMQPYRLEMGTKFANDRGADLYQFWGGIITDEINKLLAKSSDAVLVNLASNEYYKVVQADQIQGRVLTINFKEWRRDAYRFVSFSAKRARGLMARYMIDQRAENADALRGFDVDGYAFNEDLSSEDEWIFTRHPI